MDDYRLKMKIGNHEFDAQGDKETVNEQFQAFKELILLANALPQSVVSYDVTATTMPPAAPPPISATTVDAALDKIMKMEKRVVSLTVRPQSPDDAILLILYGQKVLRQSDAVTGFEVNQGLTVSGQGVSRPDRILDKAAANNLVIVVGQNRSRTYRLTNAGLSRAREVANALINTVA